MRVSKGLVYANIAALSVNAIMVWLTIVKACPPLLGMALLSCFLGSSVWFSLKVNGLLGKKRPETFHCAATQKVESW